MVNLKQIKQKLNCTFPEAKAIRQILTKEEAEALVGYPKHQHLQEEVLKKIQGQIDQFVKSLNVAPKEKVVKTTEEIKMLDDLKPMIWAVKTIGSIERAEQVLAALKSLRVK